MKLITRLLLGLIAVVATLFIAAAFLISTVNLDQHKDRIQQFVFDQTGRSLDIRGHVEAQLFPWAGFALEDVQLAGADGFVTGNFANVKLVEARVRLLPLIVGSLSIKTVHLQGLELDLQRNAEGRTNWDDLMSNTSVVTADVSDGDVLQEIEAGTPVVALLSVGELQVSDGLVHWRDETAGQDFYLSDFRLSAGTIKLSEPFRILTGFTVNRAPWVPDASSTTSGTRIDASGLASINLAENVYQIENFRIDSTVELDSASTVTRVADAETAETDKPAVRELAVGYSGSVLADFSEQRIDFAPLAIDVDGIVLNGELHMTNLIESPGAFGYIATDAVDVAGLLERYGTGLPSSFDKTLLQDIKLSANFQRADDSFLINEVIFGNQHAELTGNFQIANFLRAPVLTGSIASNTINPLLWTESLGFTPVDKSALSQARLTAQVRQSGQLLVLNDVAFTIDDSTISGDIEFVKTEDGQYPIRFELAADQINADRYIDAGALLDSLGTYALASTQPLQVDRISNKDIQGVITATQLQWAGLEFTDVSMPLRVEKGRVEGQEIKATTHKGTLFATTVLDVTPEEPLLTATASLNAVDLKPMLSAMGRSQADKEGNTPGNTDGQQTGVSNDESESTVPTLAGTGIVNIDLLSRGSSLADLVQRAGGALNIRITDGAIENTNLARTWVSELVQQAQGNAPVKPTDGEQSAASNLTRIDELSMSWELAHGNLYSNDLEWRADGFRIEGLGGIDLARQSADYLLQMTLIESDSANDTEAPVLAAEHNRVAGTTVPLVLRGPLQPLVDDFVGALNNAYDTELRRMAAGSNEATLDTLKSQLSARSKDVAAALSSRLSAVRDAAQPQPGSQANQPVQTPEGETEATNRVSTEIERETDELKNRLQQNLQKDPNRKLSTLADE
jgi:AsmA protein